MARVVLESAIEALQRACPAVHLHVCLVGDELRFDGYLRETSESPSIVVRSTSLADAEREYKAAYRRMVAAGIVRAA